MGFPCVHQELLQHIAALLSEGCGHGQQSAVAEPAPSGLDAIAEFAVDHGWSERAFCGVVGGHHQLGLLQEGPQGLPVAGKDPDG